MLCLGQDLLTDMTSEAQTLFCAFLAGFGDVQRPFLVVYSNKSEAIQNTV